MIRALSKFSIVLCAAVLLSVAAWAAEYYPLRGLEDPAARLDEFTKACEENPTPGLLATTGWLLHLYRNDNESAGEFFEEASGSQLQDIWTRYGLCVIKEIEGDFDGVLSHSLAICEANPSHPVALLALLNVRSLFGKMAHFNERVQPVLQGLLEGKCSGSLQFDEVCREILSAIASLKGDEMGWERLVREGGYITEWRIVGPFGEYPNLSFLSKWKPESERALANRYRTGGLLRETRQYASKHGRLRPQWIRPGVHYAETFLTCRSAEEVTLRISSYSPVEIFLNNHSIYMKDGVRKHCPVTQYLRVRLSAGNNRLLLKFLEGGRAFHSRRPEFKGLPTGHGVSELLKRAPSIQIFRHPYGSATIRAVSSPRRWGRIRQVEYSRYAPSAVQYFSDIYQGNSEDPLAAGLCGILHAVQGDVPASRRLLRAALKGVSSYSYFNYALGDIVQDDPSLPIQFRNSEAEARFRAALDAANPFPLALYQIALHDLEEDRDEEAIEKLQQCIAVSPEFLPWHDSLYGIYESKGWSNEQRLQLDRILALSCDSCRPYHIAENYYRSTKQYARLAEAIQNLQSRHLHPAFAARYYYELGRDKDATDEYLKLKAAQPHKESLRRPLIELYQRRDRWVDAERELKEATKLFPEELWFQKELAALKGHTGRSGAERRIWRRILRDNPVDRDARKALRANGHVDMLDEFVVSLEPYIHDQELREKYEGVSSAMIIDQVVEEIYADCSSRQKTHQLILLNDKKAIDQWGELDIPDEELLELRTIKKDGTIVEPEETEGGKWAISMAGLQEGDFIEFEYITSTPRFSFGGNTRPRRFLGARFFFQSVDVPMELSQYVIIAPEDMKVVYEQVNFAQRPTLYRKKGKTIYKWEATDVSAMPSEPLASPERDFLPFVRVAVNYDGDRDALRYQDRNVEMTKLTDEIREATASVLSGCSRDVESQVRAIYSYVNKEIRGDGGSVFLRRSASETLANRQGDRLCLAKTMLDAAGIECRMLIVRGKLAHVSDVFSEGFTSALLGIPDNNGGYAHLLDFGNRYVPFGYVRSSLQQGSAIPLDDFSRGDFGLGAKREKLSDKLFSLPRLSIDRNCERRTLIAELRKDGALKGTQTHEFTGDDGASLREAMINAQPYQIKNFIERMANMFYRGAVLADHKVEDLSEPERPLRIQYAFEATNYGRVADEKIVLDQWLPLLQLGSRFASLQTRKTPLHLGSDTHTRFRATLKLPAGTEVEALPSAFRRESDFGFYKLHVSEAEGSVQVENRFYLEAQRISPEDYPRFAEFCRSIDEAERKEMRLRLRP